MMLGERTHHLNPTVQVPPWPVYDDPSPTSPYLLGDAAFSALRRFLPSNDFYASDDDEIDSAIDAYTCDEFRIYEFKVRRCARGRSHDWTECPYAHPGEKARRRDPRKYHYSGTACPDFRKGNCKRGDSCEFAHGVFECWLHPARYRTQPCKDGVNCRRRVCFFAHTPEQLRLLPNQSPRATGAVGNGGFSPASCRNSAIADSYDGSPLRQQHQHHLPSLVGDGYLLSNTLMSSSPTSTLISPPKSPPSESPPLSPMPGGSSVNELLLSLRQLQLNKAAAAAAVAKSSIGTGGSWGMQQLISPRGLTYVGVGVGGGGVVPTTPTRMSPICGGGLFDGWEEPVERVESGRDLRAMMAKKLSKENSLESTDDGDVSGDSGVALDVDWISDLVE